MAGGVHHGYSEEHWTAQGWMKGAALVIGVVAPFVGLVVILPALISAARAGTSKKVYVAALGLSLLWVLLFVLAYAGLATAQPVNAGPHPV